MNNKIFELLELAQKSAALLSNSNESKQKIAMGIFAESIISECLIAVDKTNTHHAITSYDYNIVKATISKSKQSVKEHFGMQY